MSAPTGRAAAAAKGRLTPGCSPEVELYRSRRAELGFDVSPSAPLLLDGQGRPATLATVADYLRRGRTTAVSIEGNAGFCRGLLATRYPAHTLERSAS